MLFKFQNNPADNLLKADGTHKWKCATVGEKSISIVLQVMCSAIRISYKSCFFFCLFFFTEILAFSYLQKSRGGWGWWI